MTHDEQNNSSDTGSKVPMTHDELLAKINTLETRYTDYPTYLALRAVVDLHKPIETYNMNNVHKSWFTCNYCNDEAYPCPTIQAIEEELK